MAQPQLRNEISDKVVLPGGGESSEKKGVDQETYIVAWPKRANNVIFVEPATKLASTLVVG